MREEFEQQIDELANELGAKIAAEATSEDEYQEGLEIAISTLQDAWNASVEFSNTNYTEEDYDDDDDFDLDDEVEALENEGGRTQADGVEF